MTSKAEQKVEQHYLDERIDHDNDHVNEHTTLLKMREDLLNASEIRLNSENKIFWLETFSMFIFIFASTCSKTNTGVDLAFFVGILMAIPICATQTGANLNPAVSFSMFAKNQSSFTLNMLWIYFKAQAVGAIISMAFAVALNDVYRSPLYPEDFTVGEVIRMILSEIVGVFTLIFFVLFVTGPVNFIENNGAKYFYISVFVYIGRRFAASSGNQINFALTLSQAFVGVPECNYSGFKYLWIWLIGDALGVIVAAQFYNRLFQPTLSFMKRRELAKQEYRKAQESAIELKEIPTH